MTVLPLDDDGYLPATPVPVQVTFNDVYDTFVDGAPHHGIRDQLYRAVRIHAELLTEVFGPAKLWIGGTFVSRAAHSPARVDTVYICRDVQHYLRNLKAAQFQRVLSLSSVIVGYPRLSGADELHPVGGLVNTVQVRPEQLPLEYERLSHALTPDHQLVDGSHVGFVEVRL